jgi:multiple sugar transport system permease protein
MTTSARAPDRPGRGGGGGIALANLFTLLLLAYFLVPLVWLFLASTKSNSDLFQSFGFWFAHFNLFENLNDLFARDHGAFVTWMRNTLIYAGSAALGSTLISAFAGYAFAMYRFRGRGALFGMVLGSVFVPATVLAVPLYFLLTQSGLGNSLLAVILPALANPFGVYLMRIFAERAIPEELIDAARVDGAGELRIFATIASRLLAPGLVTVLLFAFVGAWNNYFLPLLVLSKTSLYPVTVGLANWNSLAAQPGEAQSVYALVVTGSVLAILPVMLVFLFLQRYWQDGLSMGSLKG